MYEEYFSDYVRDSDDDTVEITIDVDSIKRDLLEESYGAAFVGGFGGGLAESSTFEKMSAEDIVQLAIDRGYDLHRYVI